MTRPGRDRRLPFPVAAPMRFPGSRFWVGVDPYAWVVALAALLLLATRQDFTVPYTGLGLPPAELILLVLALLWVATRVIGQRLRAGLGVLGAVILVRVALLAVSYGLGAGRLLSSDQWAASDRTFLTEIGAAMTVVVLATLVRSRRDIEFVIRALVVGASISAVFALVEYGTGVDLAARARIPGLREAAATGTVALLREGIVRGRGAASVPLELGAVAGVCLPLAAGLFYAARARREHAWPWALAVVLLIAGGAVSLSRSTFLAAGVGLLVMLLRWPLRRVGVVVVLLVVAFGAAAASGAQLVRAFQTVLVNGSDDYSLGSRSNGRTYVWEHFADHLWFGQGVGTYDLTRQPILDNQYLSQVMETGILGLAALVVLLGVGFAYALRATARRTAAFAIVPTDARELAIGLSGALAAFIVVESVLDSGGFAQVFSLQWLLIGLAAALRRYVVSGGVVCGNTASSGGTNRGRGSLTAQRPPRASIPG